MPSEGISSKITLPCGREAPNRIVKAALSEALAERVDGVVGVPGEQLCRLYHAWAVGGSGMILTGNVMVDKRYRENPRALLIDREDGDKFLPQWAALATAASSAGGVSLVQLSHSGRQTPLSVSNCPIGPSAVPVQLPGPSLVSSVLIRVPKAATVDEIDDVVDRFVYSALFCQRAGFGGVEIHSAHGYLLSSFLSPRVNKRNDCYGGSPEHRRCLLLRIVKAILSAVEASGSSVPFVVGVKLNSSDFQKGGLSNEESVAIVSELARCGVDFVEISGGTYESAALMGVAAPAESGGLPMRASTKAREAYFGDFAALCSTTIVKAPLAAGRRARMAIVLTGGFRTRSAMNKAVADGVTDFVGLGRPLALAPDAAGKLVRGGPEAEHVADVLPPLRSPWLLNKLGMGYMIESMLQNFWFARQMERIASNRKPSVNVWRFVVLSKSLSAYYWDPAMSSNALVRAFGFVSGAGAVALDETMELFL